MTRDKCDERIVLNHMFLCKSEFQAHLIQNWFSVYVQIVQLVLMSDKYVLVIVVDLFAFHTGIMAAIEDITSAYFYTQFALCPHMDGMSLHVAGL